jgi:5-methylcytosine-specific restriction endonuclease McrA
MRPCDVCGTEFAPPRARSRHCSKRCAKRAGRLRYYGAHPEKLAAKREQDRRGRAGRGDWRHGDPQTRRDNRYAYDQRRRAAGGEPITLISIAERDDWACYLCDGPPVTRADWSLDHVVPLVRGGTHTRDNAKLAHHRCNSRKGTKLLGELPALPWPFVPTQGVAK